MTDLESAGRALVARQPVPIMPIEQVRARADAVARRRRSRRRGAAVVAVLAVVLLAGSWRLATSEGGRERVATTPSSAPSTTVTTAPSTSRPPKVPAASSPGVSAARLTRADLGMAATFDPATGRSRLWLTRDSRTWRDVTPSGGIAGDVEDVFALDRLHLWATSYDCAKAAVTAWRTVDGGRTWSQAAAGNHSCSLGAARIQFVDPLHGWIVLNSPTGPVAGLAATSDGGASWTTVDARLPRTGEVMFYTPRDGYLGGTPSIPFGSGLFVTHDAGRTWSRVALVMNEHALPNPSWTVTYGVPTFVDDSTGVLPVTIQGANSVVVEWWETNDGGRTWQLRTPPSAGVAGIAPTAPPTIAEPLLTSVTGPHVWWTFTRTSTGAHSWVTIDAGVHWTDTDDTALTWPSPRWFGAANADVAWMLGAHLYATTDGGATWTQLHP
jgi:photosystem II stability/assembly factor-like uncharacterized protein